MAFNTKVRGTEQVIAGTVDNTLYTPGVFTTTSTGNIADLNFGNAGLIRMNNASLATIQGLVAGVAGQTVTIISVGASQVDLSHQDAGDATAANRLVNTATSAPTSLAAGIGVATYAYDVTTARWRLVAHNQGEWITVPFAAGNFTGSGSLTWTVAAGQVVEQQYFLVGKTILYNIYLSGTSTGGTAANQLNIAMPSTFTSSTASLACLVDVRDNNVNVQGLAYVTLNTTAAHINRQDRANFSNASVGNTDIRFQMMIPVN